MRWRPGPAAWPVAAVALSVLVLMQAGAGVTSTSQVAPTGSGIAPSADRPGDTLVAVLLALGMTAPVALAGRWPVPAASLTTAATTLCLVAGLPPSVGGLVALAVVFAAVGCTRPPSRLAWLAAPLAAWVVLAGRFLPEGRGTALAVLLLAAGAGAAGAFWRLRTESRHKDAVVEAAAESTVEHLARGERARIARELHDVVAHHVSLIALQADAARLTTPGMPPEGAEKLVAIGDTARTALTEMRRLLGVLREDADAADTSSRSPQPGLDQLTELLDDVRVVGRGGARLIVTGQVAPLDQGIELTAYRIVQEALTNARRHAAGAAVDVELDYRTDELVVRVRDDGPGPGPGPVGHGLSGMRERVAMAGGTLSTGRGPSGGFVVQAVLPRGSAA
ncbi:sensor histidine kinase [Cellulomonas sp. McL0617]|uniref:sensor histidine kinase n=1 Tax=Cellulomonas sp. McL0617 TaxID=3415675 RepID=UPI003CF9C2B9